jgi:hypothetical protein
MNHEEHEEHEENELTGEILLPFALCLLPSLRALRVLRG